MRKVTMVNKFFNIKKAPGICTGDGQKGRYFPAKSWGFLCFEGIVGDDG